MTGTASALRDYLTTPTPGSRRHAAVQRAWLSWCRLRGNPTAMAGLFIILFIVAVAALAPWLATHSPFEQNLTNRLQPPSAAHWLGTDEFGRDVYSRLVWGSRVALRIIALVTVITGPLGLLIGLLLFSNPPSRC